MKILWHASGTDRRRGKRVVAALKRDGHSVECVDLKHPIPSSAQVLFFGFTEPSGFPSLPEELEHLARFSGKIVGFAFEDLPVLDPSRIPEILRDRVDTWLKVSHGLSEADPALPVRGTLGLLPPFLPRIRVVPHLRWNLRIPRAVFLGVATGPMLPGTSRNVRVEVVRRLKNSKLPFVGGIVGTNHYPLPPDDEDLLVEHISRSQHWHLLRTSLISLAIGGNNPLSRRFFEILAAGSLAISMGLESVRWLRGRLRPGEHYVALREDLGDLEEKIDYYLGHPEEAREIAVNGRAEYLRYFHPGKFRLNLLLWRDVVRNAGGTIPGPSSAWHARGYAIRQRCGEMILPVTQIGYRIVGFLTGWP